MKTLKSIKLGKELGQELKREELKNVKGGAFWFLTAWALGCQMFGCTDEGDGSGDVGGNGVSR